MIQQTSLGLPPIARPPEPPPTIAGRTADAAHLFSVGERVCLASPMRAAALGGDVFTVTARMPHLGVRLQYRVKTPGEPYERVVTEEQLTRLSDGEPIVAAL